MAIRVSSPDKMAAVIRQVEDVCQKHDLADKDYSIITKERVLERAYREENNQKTLVLTGSIVSIAISLIGVFGLVLFETRAKRKEIGVRKVFGATTKDILDMFIVEYMALQTVAALVAFPIGYACMKPWLEQYVVQTSIPWWIYVGIFLMVALLVALCVGWRVWKTATAHPADEICKG